MKIGDLVFDVAAGQYGVVTEINPEWTDSSGSIHRWDLKIFSEGQIYFIDVDELEPIN